MKANVWAFALISLANASVVIPRDAPVDYSPSKDYHHDYPSKDYDPKYPSKDNPKDWSHKDHESKGWPKDHESKGWPKDHGSKGWPSKDHSHGHHKSYPPKGYSKPYPANDWSDNDYDNYGPYDHHHKGKDHPIKSDYYPTKNEGGYTYKGKGGKKWTWKPKSKSPQFFNLRVDDQCSTDPLTGFPEAAVNCPFNGYAIRLEGGNFVATPYDRLYDPKLATLFVDDDTSLYTVSKEPLQVYIDSVTGALKYTKIGYLPPSAISTNFFHTGNNPLGLVDPSPSYLSWPSTVGASFDGTPWSLCPFGGTLQYQVFVNAANFGIGGPAGVLKDGCVPEDLAAVNANPWA